MLDPRLLDEALATVAAVAAAAVTAALAEAVSKPLRFLTASV